MACSQTEFSLATETVEGLENEEFQEKLDEEKKNKSLKTFPLCTSARREHGEENNNKKKTNGEEMIYFKLFPWHQARMLLPRAAKQLWLRCLLGKLGISMQTEQATLSPPLLAGGIRSSKPISPALNPAFSPVPLAGTTWLKLCSVSHPKLSERKGKIPSDLSKICRAHSQGGGCNKRS